MSLFKIAISDQALDHLKQKLQVARLPDEIDDARWEYGAPLADIRRLVTRWKDGYDWRKHEKMLNDELPQFTMDIEVEGHGVLNIHYIYKKSDVANAIPLLFVHGWPGSFLEVRKILPLLTAARTPSFHVVALGLPGYGFSEGTKMKGFDLSKYAEVGHKLMLTLGYSEYVTQGGDWGHAITRNMAVTYGGQHIKAWHTNTPVMFTPPEGVNPAEDLESLERAKWLQTKGFGYYHEQSNQPQTNEYSLADSPVGLLEWIYEKLIRWTDAYPWDDDEALTWISIYWFSCSRPAASARTYYDAAGAGGFNAGPSPTIPAGCSFFPKDIGLAPKSWYTDKHIVFKSYHKHGGHFAAYEQPEELADDLRRMFGKDGPAYGVVPGKNGY